MLTRKKIKKSFLELTIGDITQQDTDAVVNAANSRLAPGGGVAGAIHRTAGPKLWEECRTIGYCGTGEAKITGGYDLKAKYIIHTVGPVYSGGASDSEKLESCYKNGLLTALKNKITSISFPSISTGIFGYPVEKASKIALNTIIDFLNKHPGIRLVRMVLFTGEDYETYLSSLEKILENKKDQEHLE
jgi:O-acetyl-ADP-ribose deacetylase (regulator of RNase III)